MVGGHVGFYLVVELLFIAHLVLCWRKLRGFYWRIAAKALFLRRKRGFRGNLWVLGTLSRLGGDRCGVIYFGVMGRRGKETTTRQEQIIQ